MKFALLDIINIIALFQLLLLIFFLLKKKPGRLANKALALFLFEQLLIITNYEFFRFKNYVLTFSPHVFNIGITALYLVGPTFYFYVKSLVYNDFRFQKKHLLHAIPFFIYTVILIFTFHIKPVEFKKEMIINNEIVNYTFRMCSHSFMLFQLFVYFIVDLVILNKYRKEIKQQYSSIYRINLSWLSLVIYGFLISWSSSVLSFMGLLSGAGYDNHLVLINFLTFFIFFNIIYYKGFVQPEIFSGIEEKPKYTSSRLLNNEAETYLSKLSSYMETKKPYLNPDLTLKDLSEQTSIPNRYLSQIINEHMNLNFYDFISKYRIDEAKSILSDISGNKTVLEVLYDSGFNSKSSFNTAFKKFTGVTPTQFKKGIKESGQAVS